MAGTLPVKKGISGNAVRNIPGDWDAGWFHRFVTDHLQNADFRNAIAGPGISITGTENQPGTIALTTLAAGFGTPTGGTVIANFPGASATLAQTSATVAELIVQLKAAGILGT